MGREAGIRCMWGMGRSFLRSLVLCLSQLRTPPKNATLMAGMVGGREESCLGHQRQVLGMAYLWAAAYGDPRVKPAWGWATHLHL